MRDHSNSLSVMSAQRVKNVDPRQLQQSVLQLKLILQRRNLACSSINSMQQLLLGDNELDESAISIADLRQLFEALELRPKQANLLARYLVEEPGQGELIFNENITVE